MNTFDNFCTDMHYSSGFPVIWTFSNVVKAVKTTSAPSGSKALYEKEGKYVQEMRGLLEVDYFWHYGDIVLQGCKNEKVRH